MKSKRVNITMTERMREMIEEIQDKRGFATQAETLRFCVSETHGQTFKDYLQKKRTPKEKRAEEEDVKKQVRRESEGLCKRLPKGSVANKAGKDVCLFVKYDSFGNEFEQEIPLKDVSEEFVETEERMVRELRKSGRLAMEDDNN